MSGPDRSRLLGIYLNDHLAGATGGVGLARRLAESFQDSAHRGELADIADQVGGDRRTLLAVMGDLRIPVNRFKVAAGWLGEKVGRLKLNARLIERSPLSGVIELEAMSLGVAGKIAGWRSLREISEHRPELDPGRFDRLIDQAEHQLAVLEEIRKATVAEVLAEGREHSRP